MSKTFFVTGTDTEVGKTFVTAYMMQQLHQRYEQSVAGHKPIAAGAELNNGQLENEDALALQLAASEQIPLNIVNPICFEAPIAPHIAAQESEHPISFDELSCGLAEIQQYHSDFLFVEGAGGWLLPLNEKELLSDWVAEQQLPVILVVGLRLGCLNHALLTYQAIQQSGANCIGWIGNQVDRQFSRMQENIDTLKQRLPVECLGIIPFLNAEQRQSDYPPVMLNLHPLLGADETSD